MGLITILLISLGVAMDACAVSVTNGLTINKFKIVYAFKIAFMYAFFQVLMPVLGWLAGSGLKQFIIDVDHWVAFALLFIIGVRMIYKALKNDSSVKEMNPLDIKVLLILSIATSIDALMIGVSIAFLQVSIVILLISIGIITFLMSFFGVLIGNKFGSAFGNKIELIGGLILIFIGVKILYEHLYIQDLPVV